MKPRFSTLLFIIVMKQSMSYCVEDLFAPKSVLNLKCVFPYCKHWIWVQLQTYIASLTQFCRAH